MTDVTLREEVRGCEICEAWTWNCSE